jgi:hypothetical protein
MAREAGKHGAHSLVAEVETSSTLFETLRTARFATYARQTIWRHDPLQLNAADIKVTLETETADDQWRVLSLIASMVPPMVQQVAVPHSDMAGLIYKKNGRTEAYIGVSEGTQGVYLLPYMHPDVMSDAADIIAAAIAQSQLTRKLPVYVCVRSYMSWLDNVMYALNFEQWVEQAVMVKQIAVGIRHPAFRQVTLEGKVKITPAAPYHWSLILCECNNNEEFE